MNILKRTCQTESLPLVAEQLQRIIQVGVISPYHPGLPSQSATRVATVGGEHAAGSGRSEGNGRGADGLGAVPAHGGEAHSGGANSAVVAGDSRLLLRAADTSDSRVGDSEGGDEAAGGTVSVEESADGDDLLGDKVRADDAAGREGDCVFGGVHGAIHGVVQAVFAEAMACLLVVNWMSFISLLHHLTLFNKQST